MQARRMAVVAALVSATACTSVKVLQREGCWVKQTDTWPMGSSEELGFCARPATAWAQDRMARLVQECLAQADYRWQNRAAAAWSRGQPIPSPEGDGNVAKTCMSEASAALGIEAENAALKARVAELSRDLDAFRKQVDDDHRFLQKSSTNMVDALGEAAKKPAPSAVATATGTGSGNAQTEAAQAPPATTIVGINGAPAAPVVAQPAAPANPARLDAAACIPARRSLRAGDKAPAGPLCADKAALHPPQTAGIAADALAPVRAPSAP